LRSRRRSRSRAPAVTCARSFPHPAHVALFGLERTLKYKRKPGRTPGQIVAEYRRYQALLGALATATPPLLDAEPLLTIDVATRRGRALREVEEALDALTCAYVAWYGWWHGPAQQLVYGSVSDGHILVPHPGHRRSHSLTFPDSARIRECCSEPITLYHPRTEEIAYDRRNHHSATRHPQRPHRRVDPAARWRRGCWRRWWRRSAPSLAASGSWRCCATRSSTIAKQQGAQLAQGMGGDSLIEFTDSLRFWTQDNALEIDVLAQDGERFAFNVTRCRYAELYRSLGIPELGAVLSCNRDWALIQGFNDDIKLERTQTIMEGAAFCDFRYRRAQG
jgi:hypothetical protein